MGGTVGERIKIVINDAGLSTHAFAKLAGIKDSSLRDFVNDKNHPGMDALVKISEAAEIMLDWLILGTGVKNRKDAIGVDWFPWVKDVSDYLDEDEKRKFEVMLRSVCRLPSELRKPILEDLAHRADERVELEELRAGKVETPAKVPKKLARKKSK